MYIVESTVPLAELQRLASPTFGELVKAVVDVEKEILIIDADLHADEEEFLLEQGSRQEDLWGINLYPNKPEEEFIEFDSMINLRPSFGNSTRGVDEPRIRERIIQIVRGKVDR